MWIAALILSIALSISLSQASQPERSFTRLATYWDAPGVAEAVSPDNHHVIIYDERTDTARLVAVNTGEARVERRGRESIRFNPDGQLLILYNRDNSTYQIAETDTLCTLIQIPAGIPKFSDDNRYLLNTWRDENTPYQTQVIDLRAGRVMLELPGMNAQISPDSRFVSLFYYTDGTTVVHELPYGQIVAEFAPTPDADETTSDAYSSARFSPDGNLLALNEHHHNRTHLIDTDTWETRYSVNGFVRFSPNGQFLVARASDGIAAGVQLVQTETGAVLDETFGGMSFSPDGNLLYRAEAVSNNNWHIQAVHLASGDVIAEQRGWIALRLIADHTVIEVHDNSTHTTRFVNVASDRLLWEVEGSASVFDEQHFLAVVNQRRVVNVATGEVLVTADQPVIVSPDGTLVFAPHDGLVDLYGAADARADTMPMPRP